MAGDELGPCVGRRGADLGVEMLGQRRRVVGSFADVGQVLFAGSPGELVADENVRRLYLGESFTL